MKRFSLLGSTLFTMLMLSALATTSASAALPELLGTKAFPQKWTGTGGELTIETLKGERITCKEGTLEGEQTTDTLSVYHRHYLGCQSSGFKCNTEGDPEGVILLLGEFHFVSDFLSAEHPGVAVLWLFEDHVKCSIVLWLFRGHLLCLVLTPLTSAVTHEFHCKTVSTGMPEDKHWWNDSGTEETAVFLVNKNEGTFEESASIGLGVITFPEPVAFHAPF